MASYITNGLVYYNGNNSELSWLRIAYFLMVFGTDEERSCQSDHWSAQSKDIT
jgi:hypothetical protein